VTERSASAEPIRPGRHARTEVDLDAIVGGGAAGTGPVPVELSLAAPFGALLLALLERPFRLSKLSLDYVAPDRLSSWATFSARVSDVQAAGEATVSLLVFKGARLYVRGQASLVVAVSEAAGNGKADATASCEHMNGVSR
jgi:hypothetical protein